MTRIKILLIFLSLSITLKAQENIDLFIWAGQSNAQGWMGDAAHYPEDRNNLDGSIKLNWTFVDNSDSDGQWITMQPQQGRFPKGHFGPEVSFSRELKKAGYNPAIFKYTKGATGLARDWKLPGKGGIYDQMTFDLKQALSLLQKQGYTVTVRGFIWIQGESDAGNEETAKSYYLNLKQLIDDLRSNVLGDQTFKVVLGVDEQHAFVQERPTVVQAQKRLAAEDSNTAYTSMYDLPKADATHLTPDGLVRHGRRVFDAYTTLIGDYQKSFADYWEYVGIAVEEPGYTIWGTSPIIGDDGKTHLFVARWPCELKVDPGWRSHSEIAHYIGDSPEGPFKFSDVAIKSTGKETWDKFGAHNPTVHRVDDKYVLLYIGNSSPKSPDHPANQQIGMALADSPNGPWTKVGKDGLILSPPVNEKYWNYKAGNGVNNPAFLQHPNGGFFLYFKSEKARMGLAIAENLEGPYVQMPFPVTANNQTIEDGYAFMYQGNFALLTTDNHGIIEPGGGILWTSDDGIKFKKYEKGMHRIADYNGGQDYTDALNPSIHYGPASMQYAKPERPQVLLIEDKPKYLYVGSGHNIYGGDCTVSYVLKFK